MKTKLPCVATKSCRAARIRAGVPVFALTGLLAGIALLVRAQNASNGDTAPASSDLAWQAITNPVATAVAADAQMTAEQQIDRAFWRWAFEHPGEYYRKYIQNDPARAVAAEAQQAILNPVEATARFLAQRTAERKAQDDQAAFAIEHPAAGTH